MFVATRRRLAIWYTAVTAVLLLLCALGFYLFFRSTLIERVDDTLNHVVEVVQRSLVVEAPSGPELTYKVNLEASFRQDSEAVEDDRIEMEWFDPEGHLQWSTLSDGLNLPIHLSSRGETVAIAPDFLWRQLTKPIEVDGQKVGYLRVSHPWFEVSKPTRELGVELGLGLTVMITLVALTGWLLSRLAMEPISDSYESLKRFTADASHELRNPIALIQTTVQVALSDPNLDEGEHRQPLETVERVTQRLGRLVDDLLFLARQDSGIEMVHRTDCPLDALLMEVVDEQTAIAQGKAIQIDLSLGDEVVVPGEEPFNLQGDYDQLYRLFTNLVGNAIQYSPPQSQVDLSLRGGKAQGQELLVVKVSDRGVGIPPEALPRLFDRFYRVDTARSRSGTQMMKSGSMQQGGTGLGLAIAQAIAQAHEGQIQVSSVLTQGTTFTVRLPVKPAQKRQAEPPPNSITTL